MKHSINQLLFVAILLSLTLSFITYSCQEANASTQTESIQIANEQPLVHNLSNTCIEATSDSNPKIGTIEISKKTYDVHKGPRGGLYIWKTRLRDTSSGTKGSCYKYSIPADRHDEIQLN
jgi:hypothetical protein